MSKVLLRPVDEGGLIELSAQDVELKTDIGRDVLDGVLIDCEGVRTLGWLSVEFQDRIERYIRLVYSNDHIRLWVKTG